MICVYLSRRISLTAKFIWFSFTVYFLVDPRKFITILGGNSTTTFQEKLPLEKIIIYFFTSSLKTKIETNGGSNPHPLECPWRSLGAQPLVMYLQSSFVKNINVCNILILVLVSISTIKSQQQYFAKKINMFLVLIYLKKAIQYLIKKPMLYIHL